MKTFLKVTLLAASAVSAIALPVSAGSHYAELRGLSDPYDTIAKFEGLQSSQARHDTLWQHNQLSQRIAEPRYVSSKFSPSYNPVGEYYNAPKSYAVPRANKRLRKFGYGNVYDYESGHCGQACAAPTPRPLPRYISYSVPTQPVQTYRQITQYKCWDGEIVNTSDGCKRQTITQTIPQFRCWDGEIVTDENGCKRQTITRQVLSTHNSSNFSIPLNCPSGTTAQSDGTCLESSSMPVNSYGSASDYSNNSSFNTTPTNCPAGTTAQSDGTCMEDGLSGYTSPYAGSSINLFRGYSSGDNYGSGSNYLPIRK